MVKPIADHQGNGVQIISVDKDLDTVFKACVDFPRGVALEELIEQSDELAKFHPNSVNTIRLVTFHHKEKLTKICAVLRM